MIMHVGVVTGSGVRAGAVSSSLLGGSLRLACGRAAWWLVGASVGSPAAAGAAGRGVCCSVPLGAVEGLSAAGAPVPAVLGTVGTVSGAPAANDPVR